MATTAYHTLAILIYGTVLYSGIADARILVFDAYNETVDEFSDIEVPYGSDLFQTLKGLVVLANPFDACSPIQDAYNSSIYASFVLMFGNVSVDCPGHLKVLNAQRAGFDAAILFGGMLPFGQVAVSSEAVIPALIVEYKAGLRIMNNYIFKNKNGSDFYWLSLIPYSQDISYYITIFCCIVGFIFLIFLLFMIGLICLLLDEVDSKFSGHFILHNDFFYNYWHLFHDNASLHNLFGKSVYYWMELIPYSHIISYCLMMFSVISGICLMIMVIFTIRSLVKCVRERRRTRRNRLSARQIRQLGTERFTAGAPYDTCAICLEEYKEGEKLRILPCGHVYHMKCIDPWLQNNRRTCPLCKRRIRFGDSDSSSSNDSDTSSLHTNEESPLIPPPPPPHHQTLRVSVSDSSLLVQRVTSGLMQLLGETNEQFQNAEENDHPDVLLEPQSNHEVSDSHPSTYGSVNNSEGDEFVDALTPGETSTSSVVIA